MNCCEIEIDCEVGLRVRFESFQLRMICVATGFSAKNCFCKQ